MQARERSRPLLESATTWQSMKFCAEVLGGAIGIAAAQAVFVSYLKNTSAKTGVDVELILQGGATNFKQKMSEQSSEKALELLNAALTRTFFVATAAGTLPFALAIFCIICCGICCCCCVVPDR
jgi:hypothetical protein